MKSRIVLILSIFPQPSETFIVQKFLGLLAAGWDVHIVCGRFSPQGWDAYTALRSNPALRRRVHAALPARPRLLAALLFLPVLLATLLGSPRASLRYLRRGWRLHGAGILRRFYLDTPVIRLAPDLIHFEFGALAVGRETLARCLGSRMLVSFRGYDLNFIGLEDPNYYTQVWNSTDGLHLLGADLWQRARRRGCPATMPHALIPPAVDVEFFVPSPQRLPANGPLRILSVGRLEWKKGYEYGLQAIKRLREEGIACEVRIIGEGSFAEALRFACYQLGIREVVQFLGKQSREQVRDQYRWADVLLHSAVSEGFCNAVLEAQAMQLPVVCSDADGLAENIADGVTGYVVARRSPSALAERLAQLSADPGLRSRMGAAGRDRVMLHFNQTQQMDSFNKLYHALLDTDLEQN